MLSRLEQRRDTQGEHYQPEMPPIDGGEYLLTYLWEMGPVMSGGMGPVPISHAEIASWSVLTGVVLQPWQARVLRTLSKAYIAEMNVAGKPDRPAPWQPEDGQVDLSGVAKGMRNAIAKLAKM